MGSHVAAVAPIAWLFPFNGPVQRLASFERYNLVAFFCGDVLRNH